MKRLFLSAGIIAWSFCSMNAGAKTLEDVLKEKGVITEEDYKEVTKVKPFDYKLGKGFTFTTEDEKFQLSIGGRLQVRYSFLDRDQESGISSQVDDVSRWEMKQVKFYMNGYAYTKDLTYGVQANFAKGNTAQILDDAWMNYRLIDEAQLKIGQFKTPFARQELISDANQQFVDRSPVVDAFKAGRDIGALLSGKVAQGIFYYNLGVFGGAGQSVVRNTNDNLFAARVVVNPLGDVPYLEADIEGSKKPLVSIGANYFRNTLKKNGGATPALETTTPNYTGTSGWLGKGFNKTVGGTNIFGGNAAGTSTKFDVDSFGADLAFKWMGISLQGEYLLAQAEADNGAELRAHGFYAQTGYLIIPKTLEVAFRYSYLDPDRDRVNDTITEQIGAVSYYFDKHNLKIQTDVGNIHTQTSTRPIDEMQYRVQAQITF